MWKHYVKTLLEREGGGGGEERKKWEREKQKVVAVMYVYAVPI